jgi:hypothetical protein
MKTLLQKCAYFVFALIGSTTKHQPKPHPPPTHIGFYLIRISSKELIISLRIFLLVWRSTNASEGKFLVTKSGFRGSFDMSLKGDCHEVEVTPNLELLVTFGMSLEGV